MRSFIATLFLRTIRRIAALPVAASTPPADIEKARLQQALQIARAEKTGSVRPQKYADQGSSDLRFEVVDGENFFEIKAHGLTAAILVPAGQPSAAEAHSVYASLAFQTTQIHTHTYLAAHEN